MASGNATIFKGATSFQAICGSALMWSWWDLAFYNGIYMTWDGSSSSSVVYILMTGMVTSSLVLYCSARFSQKLSERYYDRIPRLYATAA